MVQICGHVLCSDCTKKLAKRASVEQSETSHKNLNSSLTEAADKQCSNTDRLTPRALRYARRSGGLVEPGNQPDKKTSGSTSKSPHATYTAHSSVGTSKTTDSRGSGLKRHSTECAVFETRSKVAKKQLSQSASSSSKPRQDSAPKKQATQQKSPKNTVVGKQTYRRTSLKTSNLEHRKDKAAKGDKPSAKASVSQPSVGATAAAKKRLQRSSATATAGAEASSSSVVTGETASVSTSTARSSRPVTRRVATKRGGALLTTSGHLTDTTGSCASSK